MTSTQTIVKIQKHIVWFGKYCISFKIPLYSFDKIGAKISGENPPKKIDTFKEANLRDILLENIEKSGYQVPTPVQKYAIPIIREKVI